MTPEYYYYTSVANHKGLAVVDYFITRQSDFHSITKLEVRSPMEVIESENIAELIMNNSRPP